MSRLRSSVREALGVRGRRRSRSRRRRAASLRAKGDVVALWEVIATMLLRFGGASSGNAVEIFSDGDEAFEATWHEIDLARRRVWCETYILEPDRVGTRTIEALTQAAKRGCHVRLLYDALGSPRVNERFLKPLRDVGAEIDRFNPVKFWKRRYSPLMRDHRKIIVIDNHTAFAGGMNISEDYASGRHGNGRFRDCQVRLRGPCVRDLANVLLDSLRLIRDDVEPVDGMRRAARKGETFVQALASRGLYGRRAIQRSIRLTVRHCLQRCWMTTPYFVPPRRLMKAMIRAAKRGVDVRVMTAGVSDVPVVRAASQHIYGGLLKHGVRIFELYGTTLHAKTMTLDSLYATVGSFNLDRWSDQRNLEVNVGMIDPETAKMLEREFEADLANAREVTLHTWNNRTRWQRLVHWCAYQVMRL
jgi:cardiolipin synthase